MRFFLLFPVVGGDCIHQPGIPAILLPVFGKLIRSQILSGIRGRKHIADLVSRKHPRQLVKDRDIPPAVLGFHVILQQGHIGVVIVQLFAHMDHTGFAVDVPPCQRQRLTPA